MQKCQAANPPPPIPTLPNNNNNNSSITLKQNYITSSAMHQPFTNNHYQPDYPESVGCLLEQILILTAKKQRQSKLHQSNIGSNEHQFIADVLPKISIKDYVLRLHTYTQLSQSCVISTLIYIDRVMQKYPNMNLSFSNIHRLVLSCFIIAAKYLQDELQTQQHLSRVAGVSIDELLKLQIILMDMLQWNAYISLQQYLTYKQKLDIIAYQSFTKKQQTKNNKIQTAGTIQITNEYIIKDSQIKYKFSSDCQGVKCQEKNSGKTLQIGKSNEDKKTNASTLSSSSDSSSDCVNKSQIRRNNSFPDKSSSCARAAEFDDDRDDDQQEEKDDDTLAAFRVSLDQYCYP